jgi:hypothetical protein
MKTARALALLLIFGIAALEARPAFATHEAGRSENAQQNLTSNGDQSIVASAAATPIAGCGVDSQREEADVVIVSGSGRIGDSTTSTSSGISVTSGNPPLKLEATNQLYAYSDGGMVISCTPIDR